MNQALNLTNRDSGLFGDVSDPYVVVRCGGRSEKTKVVNNDLNPVWQAPVGPGGQRFGLVLDPKHGHFLWKAGPKHRFHDVPTFSGARTTTSLTSPSPSMSTSWSWRLEVSL